MASQQDNSPKNTYRLMAFVAIAVIILIGFAIFSLSKLQTTPWSSNLKELEITAASKTPIPQFEYKNLNSQNFDNKWTLFSFWSYACAPCLEEVPALNQLQLTWQGPELQVMLVNTDNSEALESAKNFLLQNEISLSSFFDPDHNLGKAFKVEAIPAHFLISPDKSIVWSSTGAYKWDSPQAKDQLIKLIEQQAPELNPDPVE